MKNACHMCLMPLKMSPTPPEKENYCSYCFKDGEFTYKGNDVKEFQQITYRAMREKGIGFIQAKFFTWMIGFAPHWKQSAAREE
jgi:hypothetical protein